jgi:hypothetical protein
VGRKRARDVEPQPGRRGVLADLVRRQEAVARPAAAARRRAAPTEDGIARTIAENHALRAQVRQLTQDNRRLQERLSGARDTNRFLDKRIADLEAGLLAATPRGQQEAPQCT